MKRFLFLGILLGLFIVSGCTNPLNGKSEMKLTGDQPPNVVVEVDGEDYETTLGSYCWESSSKGNSICVDTAGPKELVKDKEPIQIKAGQQITLKMDYTPKPNKIHLTQIKNDVETEIEMRDNQFTVPNEKGIYFYSYGVWWMDEKVEYTSKGDAFYAFVIEVQ